MLGHTKITTTQHYITTNRKFLKEEMSKVAEGYKGLFKK
jgi:site-specific recombinase XerD